MNTGLSSLSSGYKTDSLLDWVATQDFMVSSWRNSPEARGAFKASLGPLENAYEPFMAYLPNWRIRFSSLISIAKVRLFYKRMRGLDEKSIYYNGPSMFLFGREDNDPVAEIKARLARRGKGGPPFTLALGGCCWLNWIEPGVNPEFKSRAEEFFKWMDISHSYLVKRFGAFLLNVTLQFNVFPHMHFMVLTTGTEGQNLTKPICGSGYYFKKLCREYVDFCDQKLGREERFPEPFVIHRPGYKAPRSLIAEYCRVRDYALRYGDKPIHWTSFKGIWLWERRFPENTPLAVVDGERAFIGDLWVEGLKGIDTQEGRFKYLRVLWELNLFKAAICQAIIDKEYLHQGIRRTTKMRCLTKYVLHPNTYRPTVKGRKLYLGHADIDLGQVLTRIFGAKLIGKNGPDNSLGLEFDLGAKNGLATLVRYQPRFKRETLKRLKYDIKFSGQYTAQKNLMLVDKSERFNRQMFSRYRYLKTLYSPWVPKKVAPPDTRHFLMPDGGRITILGNGWYDHQKGKAGAGSITLVGHIMNLRPGIIGPLKILASRFGPPTVKKARDHYLCHILAKDAHAQRFVGKRHYVPPPPFESLWPNGKQLLLERGLESHLVDLCHQKGLVYTNVNGSLVFPCQGQGCFILFCGNEGPDGDRWWWPAKTSGLYVLSGSEKGIAQPESSLPAGLKRNGDNGRKPDAIILADNPVTAFKAKTTDFGKTVVAVGLGEPPNGLIQRIYNRKISLMAENCQSFDKLERILNGLDKIVNR
jgi:hypothetical protein